METNTARLVNIIFAELNLQTLKLQEQLDSVINSSDSVNDKVFSIKQSLRDLVINDIMIAKLQLLTQPQDNASQDNTPQPQLETDGEKFNELEKVILDMREDVTKFYEKGNNAAGLRVRKALQVVKTLAQEVRKSISDEKNKND